MTIRDWPDSERPREKLLLRGAAALSDAELLAVFLGSGLRGMDAVELGRDLLRRHGGLRPLLRLPPAALLRERGLGAARTTRLLAALELAARHLCADLDRGDPLGDPGRAAAYFSVRLRDRPQEVFACAFLDSRHRMIVFEELFTGSLDGADVYPREVVRRCLQHNAAAVIFGHNHPSGVTDPSAADRAVTRRLVDALRLVDIRVLDHFIVGDGPVLSFAARGWL
ncbi:RadC family protein [Chiayiivirga flava]|uniref:DNA repair protein RadC n=1 Tax=Chiayiivirga flava TaxID=659595 RepID=A0A7W8D3Y9_9GAMM|nr:DNA repair protein RadC [Chiayiivirga flava]MBB5207508.1 DNA repair protein RadC [Chiayiivirga flava]